MADVNTKKQATSTVVTKKDDWNLKIARFFLDNGRVTVMAFIVFILVGMASFLGLKTTGFPSVEIKIALIRTIYPQASAQTIAEEVTTPIENAIKNISGIERYTSNSSDNFSLISVNIASNATKDQVINKLTTELSSVKLPTNSQKPVIQGVEVSGPDYVFTIIGDNAAQSWETQEAFRTIAKDLPETSSAEYTNQLKKVIEVQYKPSDLQAKGVQEQEVTQLLQGANQTFPIALNQVVDGTKVNILTSLAARSIEDIKNLTIKKQLAPQLPPISVKLSELATVVETYQQGDDGTSALRYKGEEFVGQAISISLKAKTGTDLTAYGKKLEDKLSDINNTQFVREAQVNAKTKAVTLVENYSVNTQNKEQVDEIIHGLIGGALKIDNQYLAQFGWIFGALQLVFLVMLVFVSWRAAVIASMSIPLSLLSAMIYLYVTGNTLNTLVLFSLVLVIGLVVDPALVVLEAIQRKKDLGLPGKTAALEAIRDIGPGLFAATLTNTIVFIPLAVISGTLGKIFSNIPATIIPALIGSYFIPLAFLTFVGAFFLKRAKGKTANETENLWPLAKWLIRLNTRILKGSAWMRTAIIVVITGLSIGITSLLIGSGKITFVQFSESSDAQFLTLTSKANKDLTPTEKNTVITDSLKTILSNKDVVSIYPISGEYYVNLRTKDGGRTTKANSVAKDINTELKKLEPKIEAQVAVAQNGPPADDYQVQLAIKTDNAEIGAKTAKVLTEIIAGGCVVNKQFRFANCEGKTRVVDKILDGYADFSQKTLKVVLDPAKLEARGLTTDSVPAAVLTGGQLRNGFPTNPTEAVVSIAKTDGASLEVYTRNIAEPLTTKDSLNNYQLTNLRGETVLLSEVATIKEETLQTSVGRLDGETLTRYQIKLSKDYGDQGNAAQYETALLDYLKKDGKSKIESNGFSAEKITTYSAGGSAEFVKSFSELGLALLLAIVFVYVVLSLFMRSFSLPIVVLYTIPVTFIGIFPTLAFLSSGQFGFLEIIGLIILVGLVINAAIFLIDAARQKQEEGMDEKTAIAHASGLRLRPVLLTKFTAVASLSPLVFTSEFYRNLALVIISGIVVSGFLSLITTPILYIAFRRASKWLRGLFSRKKNI